MRHTIEEIRFVLSGWKDNPVAQYTSLRRRPVARILITLFLAYTALAIYWGYARAVLWDVIWNSPYLFPIIYSEYFFIVFFIAAVINLVPKGVTKQFRHDLYFTTMRRSEVILPIYALPLIFIALTALTAFLTSLGFRLGENALYLASQGAASPSATPLGFLSLPISHPDAIYLIFIGISGQLIIADVLIWPLNWAMFYIVAGLGILLIRIKKPNSPILASIYGLLSIYIIELYKDQVSNIFFHPNLNMVSEAYYWLHGWVECLGLIAVALFLAFSIRHNIGRQFFSEVDPVSYAYVSWLGREKLARKIRRDDRSLLAPIKRVLAPYRLWMAAAVFLLFAVAWFFARPSTIHHSLSSAITLSFFVALLQGLLLFALRQKTEQYSLPVVSGYLMKSLQVYLFPLLIPICLGTLFFILSVPEVKSLIRSGVEPGSLGLVFVSIAYFLGFFAIIAVGASVATAVSVLWGNNKTVLGLGLVAVISCILVSLTFSEPLVNSEGFFLYSWQLLWLLCVVVLLTGFEVWSDQFQQQELRYTPIGQTNWDPQPLHPNDLGAEGW